jgi:hypothetical protein
MRHRAAPDGGAVVELSEILSIAKCNRCGECTAEVGKGVENGKQSVARDELRYLKNVDNSWKLQNRDVSASINTF